MGLVENNYFVGMFMIKMGMHFPTVDHKAITASTGDIGGGGGVEIKEVNGFT